MYRSIHWRQDLHTNALNYDHTAMNDRIARWNVGEDTDPFKDLDSQIDLEGLISRTMGQCSAEVYINLYDDRA